MPSLLVSLKLFPMPKKSLCRKTPSSFLEKGNSSDWNCNLVHITVARLGFPSSQEERDGVQVSHIL